jgi:hypothetical protein
LTMSFRAMQPNSPCEWGCESRNLLFAHTLLTANTPAHRWFVARNWGNMNSVGPC